MREHIHHLLGRLGQEGAAVPFSTVVEHLRREGTVVTEGILARTLAAPGSGVRLLDPWTGPHATLRPFLAHVTGAAPGPWIIPGRGTDGEDPEPDPENPGPARMRRSLRRLGSTLDPRSPGDVARWMALVEEARRLPRAA